MKGNYIGKKPSGYSAVSAPKTGMWEIYDQGQMVRDTQWTGQPWEVNNGYYLNKKWTVGLTLQTPADVQFNDDGTKLYILDQTNRTIWQYLCTTAWDISTASYDSKSFSVNAQETNPNGLFFKSDGTKFYIVGSTKNIVFQYSCGVAWDVSTAFYDNKAFSVLAQEVSTQGLFFKDDGTKFYIVGSTNDRVYQYSCSTAWDVSTGSYDSKSFSVGTQESTPFGLFFKSDGTKFYIVGGTNDTVYQYSCSTAWDVSTGSYDSKSFSVGTQESAPQGLFFKPDGTKFYIVGFTNETVYQYSCSTAWDVSTGSYDSKSFNVQLQDTAPTDLLFKLDGTKFYIVGQTNQRVFQYSCATAWDISTASYDSKSFSVASQETLLTGLFFKSDGTQFYIVGTTNDTVYQYSCSTAWDISTASYASKSFNVGTQETQPNGLFFKSDGTQFYIVGITSDTIYQYSCATAWDVSTASYDTKSFSVNTQETSTRGLFFKDDGTKFYIVGSTNDTVYQYSCSTAWDVSTGSYDSKSFSIQLQEGAPTGMTIDDSGRFLYICGTTSPQGVYQYSLV